MKRHTGFTFVEVLIVIAITLLLAGMVAPHVVNQKKSRDQWEFRNSLRNLSLNARSRAVEMGRPVSLNYDKTRNEVQVIEIDVNGAEKKAKTLAVPEWERPGRFVADQNEAVGDSWRVTFYTDGATSGGGIEFKVDDSPWCLLISSTDSTILDLNGPMPSFAFETWPAGTNVAPSSS